MLMITRFHSPPHRFEDVLKSTLQDEVNIAIGWFKENHMQAIIHLNFRHLLLANVK